MGGRPKVYYDVESTAAKRTVEVWLRGLREGTGRKTALYHFVAFMRWREAKGLEAGPDALIEACLDGTNRTLIEHLKVVQEYCTTAPQFAGDKKETRTRNYRSLRGFYAANFVPLPTARLRIDASHESRSVTDEVTATRFLEMVKQVMARAKFSVRDRAVMLVMLQSGMDDSTVAGVFNFYGYHQLVKHFGGVDFERWDASLCPVRIDLNRPKSDYRYYSYLDVDAAEAPKAWLSIRGPIRTHPQENPKNLPRSDPLFTNQYGVTITPNDCRKIFHEGGARGGVNVPNGAQSERYKGARLRYPFRSHECRDTLVTLNRKADADVVAANFFTGHSIDRLKYDKSPWDDEEYYRQEYLKLARPWLNPISGKALEVEAEITQKFEERLGSLEREIREALLKKQDRP